MPKAWDGYLESLALSEGVDAETVRKAMDLVWEWESSEEFSPAPLVVLIFKLFFERKARES